MFQEAALLAICQTSVAIDNMSSTPALRRETSALWSLHHTVGYGLRKFQGRVAHADPSILRLASATSREIRQSIERRTLQLSAEKPPSAQWPSWRTHRPKAPAYQPSSVAEEGNQRGQVVPAESCTTAMPQGRTLKAHLSDESTVLPDEEPQLLESDPQDGSSSSSSYMSALTANVRTGCRIGRRQKAKRRQLEWEEASRQVFAETTFASSSGPGSDDWARKSLVTVFEDLLDDEDSFVSGCDTFSLGTDPVSPSKKPNQNEDQRSKETVENHFLQKYAAAVACLPACLMEKYCNFRSAAMQTNFDNMVSLRSAILSLRPCVDALNEARQTAQSWECPSHLRATWQYMCTYTLEKPTQVLQHLEDCYTRVVADDGTDARRALENYEYEREDLEDCLENSVSAFVEDLKVLQYCIDREDAKRLELEPVTVPTRRVSEALVAQREQVRSTSQDDLQVLLARRFLVNDASV